MTENEYTRPERFTELDLARIRFEKRYKALVAKEGYCSVCIHRRLEETWKVYHCRLGVERRHEQCQTDKRGLVFEPDIQRIEKLKDAA